MPRMVLIPHGGKIHRIQDPGKNARLRDKETGEVMLYECRLGDHYMLRGRQRDYSLSKDKMIVGRLQTSDIPLEHKTLSRKHALLSISERGYALEDMGSSNGTFVNEERLSPKVTCELIPGDLIRFGSVRLRYIAPEAAAMAPTDVLPAAKVDDGEATQKAPAIAATSTPVQDDTMETLSGHKGGELIDEGDPMLGREVNGYIIERVLSQGGMGRLYLAYHTNLDRKCVLKTIRPEMNKAEDVMDLFRREVALGAKVWHPNVIRFYDAGQCDEFCYLAMEYFDGRHLWDLYSKDPAKPQDLIDIGVQVCAALSEAHSQGVIHRDIKPRNVLRNKEGMVKIVDFGVAKGEVSAEFSTITQNGAIVGTPAYMAPEQIRSPREVDQRIDIYALGAVLYFCGCARPPYVGKNACQILRQVGKSVPRPSQVRRGIPLPLEGVIVKAMNPKPAKRFESAAEMEEALLRLKK